MQIDVGEQRDRQDASQSQPVWADSDARVLGDALAAQLFELPVCVARVEASNETRFDELVFSQFGSPQVALVDSSNFSATWSWSRPSHELLALGDESQAKLGFETFDCAPLGAENAKRVDHHDSVFIKLNARVDEHQPNQDVNDGQRAKQAWQLSPSAGKNRWNNGQKSDQARADRGVQADLRSNGSHGFNYLHQKASLQIHEEN